MHIYACMLDDYILLHLGNKIYDIAGISNGHFDVSIHILDFFIYLPLTAVVEKTPNFPFKLIQFIDFNFTHSVVRYTLLSHHVHYIG